MPSRCLAPSAEPLSASLLALGPPFSVDGGRGPGESAVHPSKPTLVVGVGADMGAARVWLTVWVGGGGKLRAAVWMVVGAGADMGGNKGMADGVGGWRRQAPSCGVGVCVGGVISPSPRYLPTAPTPLSPPLRHLGHLIHRIQHPTKTTCT